MNAPTQTRLALLAPALFVPLWATGFIGARLVLPYSDAFTFLALRFALAALLLALWLAWRSGAWPDRRMAWRLAISGLLMHGLYLGGVFKAVSLGVEAGAAALIVGVQPILSALLARPMLGERVSAPQWVGLALGLAGVTLTVSSKLQAGMGDGRGVALCLMGLCAISIGALWRKKYCGQAPPLSGACIEFAAAAALMLALALMFEEMRIEWTGQFLFGLFWLIFVLSFGAVFLLYALLRRGAAARVMSLFFLVPPVTALIAWALFNEQLGAPELAGMALAATGVALAMRGS